MVNPSILKAHQEIKAIYKNMYRFHAYDSDIHPDWVVEDIQTQIEEELTKAHIVTAFLPTYLEERLWNALFDCIVSENIEAEIDAMAMEETYRSLMPGRI